MKKVFIARCVFIVTIFCILFVVEEVLAANNVVVVPLGGTNIYIDPRNIVSVYSLTPSNGDTIKSLTVPSDKHFVLTDIIGDGYTTIYENGTTKVSTQTGGSNSYGAFPNPITISSGIVFMPGSEVDISCHNYYSGSGYQSCHITISGYYY